MMMMMNKATFSYAGREMVWNIGPVNECEAQSAIVPFVSMIKRK
jgi:hypothetical protein